MHSRLTKMLVSLLAVGALSVPAVAEARHGSDDPAGHVRQEHHGAKHHAARHHDRRDRDHADRRDNDRADDHGRDR
ncbi:MAG: hypothetical protein ACJ780_00120 [Solirubrobacteraceae bacterium]